MINFQQRGDKISLSYFNEQGKISIDRVPIKPDWMFNYVEHPQGKPVGFNGEKLSIRPCGEHGRLSKFRIMEILDKYYRRSDGANQKWHTLVPNIQKHYIDIETEVLSSAIPSEKNPIEKIRTIAAHHQDHCVIYGSKVLSGRQQEEITDRINKHFAGVAKRKFTFSHRYFESERFMIGDFMKDMRLNASAITGWNVLKFDWSYLCGRYKHLKGDPAESSPARSMYSFYIADKWKKKEGQIVSIPYHLPIVDYMGLYETLDTSISPKESSTLDWVSFEALKVRKVKYQGSLNDLYDSNYMDYCFYNAVDAILVQLLDLKLRTFDTLQALAIAGRVQLHEGYFFSDILENLFVCEHLKRGQFIPDKKFLNEHIKFKGGYVLEPDKGIDEWVAGWDIEATYPSTICAMNFGRDTYRGTVAFEGEYEATRVLLRNPDGSYIRGEHMVSLSIAASKAKSAGDMIRYESMMKQIRTEGKPWHFDPNGKEIMSVTGAIFQKTDDAGNNVISVPKAVLIDNIKARLFHKKKVSDIAYDINQLEKLKEKLQAA